MVDFARRSFVVGAATIPFALWFDRYARAAGPSVRYDARSVQGKAMLKIYDRAVLAMRALPEGDPRGWTFQWYSHFVKGSTSKTAELARIYPSPSPWKSLATEEWNTCQAHSGQPENYFLPWHRMFVFFFEQIVRSAGPWAAGFTLPYWNYTQGGANYAVIPPEFTSGSLLVDKRNPGVNASNPIAPVGYLNLDSLKQCKYEPNGALPGFCADLDGNLHGRVHVRTGNTQNMGSVSWAAYDPVFWAHHCNIDRIWASWNAGGRKNLDEHSFLIKKFVFADGAGNRVEATIGDFLDIAKLGYSYDRLEPVPRCPPQNLSHTLLAAQEARLHVALKGPVTLGATATRATMETPPAAAPESKSLSERVGRVAPSRSLFLVVKDLKADIQPGVLYDVYVELPAGAAPAAHAERRVGTLSFFDSGHGDHEAEGAGAEVKFVSFDVTAALARLARGKIIGAAKLELTFVPLGEPSEGARPVIGDVSLVEQ
jgi:tyrosinase